MFLEGLFATIICNALGNTTCSLFNFVQLLDISFNLDVKTSFQQEYATEEMLFAKKNPNEVALDPKTVKKQADFIEKMHKNGFSFFCHHHHYEFYRHGNETVFDYILKNAPYINFTLDTYWVQYGGANILDLLDKLNGRIGCVHLKDYKIDRAVESESVSLVPRYAPVGDGLLDMKAIVKKMAALNTKYYFVEQDDACTAYADPFEQVERSIKYINGEL